MARIARFGFIIGLLTAVFFFAQPAAAVDCYYMDDLGFICDASPPPPMFELPDPLANSFLPDMRYARLDDLINVYAEPSRSAPIVRNVGDGFLFSTLHGSAQSETGELWYMINPGEYVHSADLRVVEDSEFTGVVVNRQPQRPFGWMIVDYWYSEEPGDEVDENLTKLPRYTFFEAYDAVTDDDGWIWYNIGNGRWMRQTYVSVIDVTPRPEEIAPQDFWIEIDLYEQSFAAYQGDRMIYAGLISSGLNRWPTYEGLFQVEQRFTQTKMAGAEGRVDYYFVEDVPHTMYFDMHNEIALHGAYWHDRFGYKHSHGCVNMPPRDAEWVFNWSAEAPNDLWVWVHTSDPNAIFDRSDSTASFAGP
ncbi:MAG: L,D-transpeptidase [Chloroflexi bacterium]|nr:L,D-transpeptidase [Chloroflexota bacterium]